MLLAQNQHTANMKSSSPTTLSSFWLSLSYQRLYWSTDLASSLCKPLSLWRNIKVIDKVSLIMAASNNLTNYSAWVACKRKTISSILHTRTRIAKTSKSLLRKRLWPSYACGPLPSSTTMISMSSSMLSFIWSSSCCLSFKRIYSASAKSSCLAPSTWYICW